MSPIGTSRRICQSPDEEWGDPDPGASGAVKVLARLCPVGHARVKRTATVAILFEIEHVTTYKYAMPVTFGAHRAMFLPRPATSGRLLDWSVSTSLPSKIHWVSDPLSNNVTVMEFSESAKELTFTF